MPPKKKKSLKHRALQASSDVFGHIKDKIELYATILAIIGSLFGGYFYLDSTYARASELRSTNDRLEQKILEDKMSAIESHIWAITDRYKNPDKTPQEIKDELRDLQSKKDRVKNRLDTLDKQIGVFGQE
jgi:hypothetical protein